MVVAGFAASCAGDAGLLGQSLCLTPDRFRLLDRRDHAALTKHAPIVAVAGEFAFNPTG